MGDKKPASYPVNHDEDANENGSGRTSMQQSNVPLHIVYKSLKDLGIPETKIIETVFRLGLDTGKLV